MAQTNSSATLAIINAACQWLVRMHTGEVSAIDNKAFATWLKESPVHVREYLAAELLWSDLEHVDFNEIDAVDGNRHQHAGNIVKLDTAV